MLSFVPFKNVSLLGSVTLIGLVSLAICFYFLGLPLLSYLPGSPSGLDLDVEDEMKLLEEVMSAEQLERCREESAADDLDAVVDEMFLYMEN